MFFLGWSSTLLKRDLRQGCTFREETFVVNCVYSNLADKGTNTYEIQVIAIAEKVSALVLLLLFFDMIYSIVLCSLSMLLTKALVLKSKAAHKEEIMVIKATFCWLQVALESHVCQYC